MDDVADRPIRVLHLMGRLSQGGGVQVVVRRLANGLDPDHTHLHVLTLRPLIATDALDQVPATIHPIGFERPGFRPIDRLRLSLQIVSAIRRIPPDVIQVHSGMAWLGFLASVVFPRAPFVLEVHDAPGSGRHGAATDRVEGAWARFRRVTVICHSSSVTDAVSQRWRIPLERTRGFPLAVDDNTFYPAPAEGADLRQELGIAPEARVLCVIGRLAPSKRFDRAIAVVDALATDDVHLLIIGDGPERDRLRQQAADSQSRDRVHFLGSRFGPDVRRALCASDVLLSTSEYEGFGLTLVEAMACAIPVVAMAVGGVTDIVIDGETGYLIPDGDLDGFVEAVRRLLDSPELRVALGSAGHYVCMNTFSTSTMAQAFSAVYSDLSRV